MIPVYLSTIQNEHDRTFVEALYRKHRDEMFRVAFLVLENTYDAEDVVQSVFIDLAEKRLDKLKEMDPNSIRAYLLRSVKNDALDIIRRRSKTISLYKLSEQGIELNIEEEDLIEQICHNCDMMDLKKAIAQLNPIYLDVLCCFYGQNKSVRGTASILRRKESTVKKQLERGIKLLAAELKKMGGFEHDD